MINKKFRTTFCDKRLCWSRAATRVKVKLLLLDRAGFRATITYRAIYARSRSQFFQYANIDGTQSRPSILATACNVPSVVQSRFHGTVLQYQIRVFLTKIMTVPFFFIFEFMFIYSFLLSIVRSWQKVEVTFRPFIMYFGMR